MKIFQSSQKPVSRLKPPTITRSSTLTSSNNKIETPKPVQLPDIVPNATPQPVTLNESIVNDTRVRHISRQSLEEKSISFSLGNSSFNRISQNRSSTCDRYSSTITGG